MELLAAMSHDRKNSPRAICLMVQETLARWRLIHATGHSKVCFDRASTHSIALRGFAASLVSSSAHDMQARCLKIARTARGAV